jgi:hypothetical protein
MLFAPTWQPCEPHYTLPDSTHFVWISKLSQSLRQWTGIWFSRRAQPAIKRHLRPIYLVIWQIVGVNKNSYDILRLWSCGPRSDIQLELDFHNVDCNPTQDPIWKQGRPPQLTSVFCFIFLRLEWHRVSAQRWAGTSFQQITGSFRDSLKGLTWKQ